MPSHFRTVIVPSLTMLVALAASHGIAQERDGFSNLVPTFDGQRTLGPASVKSSGGQGTFGKLLDNMKPKRTIQASKSMMGRINSSTKSMMAKTKNVLTPWKGSSRKTASKNFFAGSKRSERVKRKSSFSLIPAWLRRDEPKPAPPTLSEWIGREKP